MQGAILVQADPGVTLQVQGDPILLPHEPSTGRGPIKSVGELELPKLGSAQNWSAPPELPSLKGDSPRGPGYPFGVLVGSNLHPKFLQVRLCRAEASAEW